MIDPFSIKIGIIGGGQLAKMMAQSAKKMGFYIQVLDPTPDCPAAQVSNRYIKGDFYEEEALREIVSSSDITTYDLESINASFLKTLSKNYTIYPSPIIIEILQDKLRQKEFLKREGIPIPRFKKIEDNLDLILKDIGLPAVWKACKGGYDGRGVLTIKDKKDIPISKTSSYLEEFIDIEKELAINIAQNTKGEIKCHPVVETFFNPEANICDRVVAPAMISNRVKKEVEEIAIKVVKALGKGAVGIFGIEMFLTKNGEILVNEIAPRVHNSGHYTIEACVTSQFEQHIRAIVGLPLGSTELLTKAVMINILGPRGYEGPFVFKGIEKVLSISGASLHLYGKKITKPFRKMGHITIMDKDLKEAMKKAEEAKKLIEVSLITK